MIDQERIDTFAANMALFMGAAVEKAAEYGQEVARLDCLAVIAVPVALPETFVNDEAMVQKGQDFYMNCPVNSGLFQCKDV